jgi:uncharacterized protein (DUF1330 family)
MSAYCVFNILEITDPEKMERYRQGVSATVEQYSGRYLVIGGKSEVVEGDWHPVFPVIIEFPSLQRAHQWYDSEEYRELKELRLAATKGNMAMIEGL